MNDVKLRQLKQRVALRCELAPLVPARKPPPTSPLASRVAGGTRRSLVHRRTAGTAIHERREGTSTHDQRDLRQRAGQWVRQHARPVGRDIVSGVCADFNLVRQAAVRTPSDPVPDAAPAAQTPPVPGASLRTQRLCLRVIRGYSATTPRPNVSPFFEAGVDDEIA